MPAAESTRLYPIGEVAELTGLSADVIRVWERRYGFPKPVRRESGHRRYQHTDVQRLRRIADALALGYRPSDLINASDQRLDHLLSRNLRDEDDHLTADVFVLARNYRPADIRERISRAAAEMSARSFIDRFALPVVSGLAIRRPDDRLGERHLSLLDQALAEELCLLRVHHGGSAEGAPMLVVAPFQGAFAAGIELVGLMGVVLGVPTISLGPLSDAREIARAAQDTGARAVALSLFASLARLTDPELSSLAELLDIDVPLIAAAPPAEPRLRFPQTIRGFASLEQLDALVPERRPALGEDAAPTDLDADPTPSGPDAPPGLVLHPNVQPADPVAADDPPRLRLTR